jgi:hypothetical protein
MVKKFPGSLKPTEQNARPTKMYHQLELHVYISYVVHTLQSRGKLLLHLALAKWLD